MIIQSAPLEVNQTVLMEGCLLLEVKMSKLYEVVKHIIPITQAEKYFIHTHSIDIMYGELYKIADYIYYAHSGTRDWTREICIAYILYTGGSKNDCAEFEEKYEDYRRYKRELMELDKSYQRSMSKIHDMYFPLTFTPFDYGAFIRACKKYKVNAYYKQGEGIALTFKRVKVGNEVEGYIQYKFIRIYLNDDAKIPMRAVFGFRKFIYDTKWGIPNVGDLHPHISSGGTMCFGNRSEDYPSYARLRMYSFMIEAIKDIVHSYEPDGPPYSTVQAIRNRLPILTKLFDMNISQYDGPITPQNEREFVARMNEILNRNSCRLCGRLVDTENNNRCTNVNCTANPDATIHCSNCGLECECGEYDNNSSSYRWICHNSTCYESPDYIYISEVKYCRSCGNPDNENHPSCGDCRGTQWRQNNDGRFAAFNLQIYPWITAEEAVERWRERENAETTTQTFQHYCPACNEELRFISGVGYICNNAVCRLEGSVIRNPNETRMCLSCGATLPPNSPAENSYCININCNLYGITQYNGDGEFNNDIIDILEER